MSSRMCLLYSSSPDSPPLENETASCTNSLNSSLILELPNSSCSLWLHLRFSFDSADRAGTKLYHLWTSDGISFSWPLSQKGMQGMTRIWPFGLILRWISDPVCCYQAIQHANFLARLSVTSYEIYCNYMDVSCIRPMITACSLGSKFPLAFRYLKL